MAWIERPQDNRRAKKITSDGSDRFPDGTGLPLLSLADLSGLTRFCLSHMFRARCAKNRRKEAE
jgi:hypothetical protein